MEQLKQGLLPERSTFGSKEAPTKNNGRSLGRQGLAQVKDLFLQKHVACSLSKKRPIMASLPFPDQPYGSIFQHRPACLKNRLDLSIWG
jgi:hypothetical protein